MNQIYGQGRYQTAEKSHQVLYDWFGIPYGRGSQTFLVTEPFHIISKLAEPLLNSNKNKGKFSYTNKQLRLFI